jgi:hypothetical protein
VLAASSPSLARRFDARRQVWPPRAACSPAHGCSRSRPRLHGPRASSNSPARPDSRMIAAGPGRLAPRGALDVAPPIRRIVRLAGPSGATNTAAASLGPQRSVAANSAGRLVTSCRST